jgi:hypothetical protein
MGKQYIILLQSKSSCWQTCNFSRVESPGSHLPVVYIQIPADKADAQPSVDLHRAVYFFCFGFVAALKSEGAVLLLL